MRFVKFYRRQDGEVARFFHIGLELMRARVSRGFVVKLAEGCRGCWWRGSTFFVEDWGVWKRLVTASAFSQCMRGREAEVAEAVQRLGEVALFFWYANAVEAYEEGGYNEVCRVARAFRIMYVR